jgi:hypothetical protein
MLKGIVIQNIDNENIDFVVKSLRSLNAILGIAA